MERNFTQMFGVVGAFLEKDDKFLHEELHDYVSEARWFSLDLLTHTVAEI